jgi:hypothetical protein
MTVQTRICDYVQQAPILEQGADKQDPCKLDVLSLFPSNHVQRPGLLFYLYFPFGEHTQIMVIAMHSLKPVTFAVPMN